MEYNYKFDNLLVIGNGFDKDLGLATTYKEFVDSSIWKEMYDKRSKENSNPSLLHYLYGRRFYDKWYDIEAALLEYVSKRPDGSFVNNLQKDKEDYGLLCSTLVDYLKSLFEGKGQKIIDKSDIMRKSPAGRLLREVIRGEQNIIYSFNYTPIRLIMQTVEGSGRYHEDPIQLHGAINEKSIWDEKYNDNSIILGIETEDFNSIAPGYSFLLKSNRPEYKPSNIAKDLMESHRVIIFGHSLNKMDFGYFEEYFRSLSLSSDSSRELTIITKDIESKQTLLDNLRQMNISVPKLYTHTNVEFILTSNLENGESDDYMRFDKLLNSLNSHRI